VKDTHPATKGPATKDPIDLHAAVQERLDRIMFVKPLRLQDVSRETCDALCEGTSSDFTHGVRLNESVVVVLDHWGFAPHQYSFAVFEKIDRRWQQVRSRIEDIDAAVASAIHTLAEQALLGAAGNKTGTRRRSPQR
jgi:hypothetical protein